MSWWVAPAVLAAIVVGYAAGAGIAIGLFAWHDRKAARR